MSGKEHGRYAGPMRTSGRVPDYRGVHIRGALTNRMVTGYDSLKEFT